MSLTPNPLAKLVTTVSSTIEAPTAAFTNQKVSLLSDPNALDKAALDKKINQLSGAVGSSYNWAGTGQTIGSISDAATAAQSKVSGSTNLLQRATAGVSNIFSDVNRGAGALNKLVGGNIAGAVQNFSAGISGVAGALNNILSIGRAKDIPKGAELFAAEGSATQISSSPGQDWRVKIRLNNDSTYDQIFGPGNPLIGTIKNAGGVSWPYTPTVTLATKANYTSIETIHSNYPFYAYKNSAVDDIQITGEWSCETETEAEYWIAATMFFRSVTKMFFGQGDNAGNPPPICILDGYGSSVFRNIPVIVKSFSVDFKDDVNYIKYSYTDTWVPIMSTISVTVAPIYNRARLRQFDLQAFSRGGYLSNEGIGML